MMTFRLTEWCANHEDVGVSMVDIFFFVLLSIFISVGALRGTVRELTSLGVWLLAVFFGWVFADAVGTWFELLQDNELRRLVGFIAAVMGSLVFFSFTALILQKLLPRPDPDAIGRIIGATIGALRGAAVVTVLVLLAGLTSLPNKESWRDSHLVGLFRPVADSILEVLPTAVARQFRYS